MTPNPIDAHAEAFLTAVREGRLETVRRLLDEGADPNTAIPTDDEDNAGTLPALYFACNANLADIARILLERGAKPDDGESVFHAAEHGHVECLELLLAHGARIGDRHEQWQNTPLYFLAAHQHDEAGGSAAWLCGVQWLLEHGADPNVSSTTLHETPLHAVAQHHPDNLLTAKLLLDHGADPLVPRADGRSAYALAVRNGASDLAALFAARMTSPTTVLPVDEFLGACMRGDEASAVAMRDADPAILTRLDAADQSLIGQAAARGRATAVRLMMSFGFDLTIENEYGGTPLHWAAWFGRTDVVSLLVDAGASLNVRDKTYGSSPVAWAAHGSHFCRQADDDYGAIVELLITRGSSIDFSVNKWGERAALMAVPPVAAVFSRHGW